MTPALFELFKTCLDSKYGSALVAFELVLHRALERELEQQVQDASAIKVFRMLIREISDLRPHSSDHTTEPK